jgi:CRISP-associated protein Cas1
MTDRIIDLSDQGARLSVRHGQLILKRHAEPEASFPLDEVAVLMVSNKAVAYSHTVLAGLAEAGGVFVACNAQHLPAGIMLPMNGHHLQCERFAQQAQASKPAQKRLWQQIVRAKVALQGRVLKDFRGDPHGLLDMAGRVRSGDPDNIEAQAARRYWTALFDDKDFRRNRDAEDQNRLLNYGYAVLRAMVARAVCAAGLHPSLGLHHHNRYNPFPLADDLMEPFRPLVDRAVVHRVVQHGAEAPLDTEAKRAIVSALLERFDVDGEMRTLFDVLTRLAASLASVYAGERKALALPTI